MHKNKTCYGPALISMSITSLSVHLCFDFFFPEFKNIIKCDCSVFNLHYIKIHYHVFHACPSPLSRLSGFLYRIFDFDPLLLCQESDQHFHDLFDIHTHHLSKMYAPLIVRIAGIWYNLSASTTKNAFLTGILYHLQAAGTIQNISSWPGCYFCTYLSYNYKREMISCQKRSSAARSTSASRLRSR